MPVTNFPPDLLIITQTNNYSNAGRPRFHTKLITNGDTYLASSSNASETTETTVNNPRFTSTGYDITASGQTTGSYVGYALKRAPGFMDVVCYKGTGSATTQAHNLTVVPELMIVKARSVAAEPWLVWGSPLGITEGLYLNGSNAKLVGLSVAWNSTLPTASVFSLGTWHPVNTSGVTYVAYLFATLAGISKVGSYTGNGSSQTINCGFAAGARFILIKCTSAAGDWYVWDTARGITAANDPHLSLNSIAAEVTTDDSIDPDSTGFIVNQVAATNINVTSATYIYLAIS
jgi:hypothetical protein